MRRLALAGLIPGIKYPTVPMSDGCLQEFLLIDANSVVKAPSHMRDIEAATLPCAALQIAKAVGAKVAITSSSDEKLRGRTI